VNPIAATGRRALVTGGGRGLGRATALALASAGVDVVVTARTRAEIDETAEMLREAGVRALAVPADVGDPAQVRDLREQVDEAFGGVDIVVNNAGQLLYKPLVPLPGLAPITPDFDSPVSDDEWHAVLRTHVDGAFHVLREFVPGMLERRFGRVVNVTSNVIGRAVPYTAVYDVAKGALVQLTRSLAVEWARHGITVNAVAAGHFPSGMSAAQFEDERLLAWMLKRVPMRRTGDPAEFAALVSYLASDAAGFVTGEVITIDGGWRLARSEGHTTELQSR
jgi:NAD(P)-dependent dehydrogenase (short-subunit alcohol dehydrogenase family)